MRFLFLSMIIAAAAASALSLSNVCTDSNVQSSLAPITINGITIDSNSVVATPVYNYTVSDSDNYPGASGLSFCNVTLSYSHNGISDNVLLWYWLPAQSQFENRFLATGGGGYNINSGSSGLAGGIIYGAVTGLTDGGFGGFDVSLEEVILKANGTLNYEALFAFGYKAIHEMTEIGTALTKNYYNTSKTYTYYQGCSEGGREGWSQVQRHGDQYDGAVIGAPAFRQAFQQVNHLFSGVVEATLDYAPSPCELEKINNDTIAACDSLDGKVDGVVSRTDLCKLHYNVTASVGKNYSCAASTGFGGSTPAASGIVTAEAAAVANAILAGLHDSKGRQVYVSYQSSADFEDAQTTYNTTSGQYYATASGLGAAYIQQFLYELNATTMSIDGITYDTLRGWMLEGMQKFADTLQTVWPDLETFHAHGGKVLHYHGESDPSIPTSSSVIYQDAVRRTMYPGLGFNESFAQLDDWYRLFLIPGAAHCAPNAEQPNGPFPQQTLKTVIDWVEKGVNPKVLNGTVLQGEEYGRHEDICSFPLRPSWHGENSTVQCVYDQVSLDTWFPDLNSIPLPVYADP
ncbi:tannase [Viridothelium virens]|uniref:Carboxylic ester hydrolase n=1 Tax=Viridothelium virens TaxID=1048519 RepID=A0A6A6HNE7_VIRVR|nr:tannase [Viridothelium virens]